MSTAIRSLIWLDTHTKKIIEQTPKILETIQIPTNPTSSEVGRILNKIYLSDYDTQTQHKRFPEWLNSFLDQKTCTKFGKKNFVKKYGQIIIPKHSIKNVLNKDTHQEILEKYDASICIPSSERFEHFSKFNKLRQQYNSLFSSTKKKLPDTVIQIHANGFGLPPPQQNIFNKYVKRMIKLQSFIKSNPPLTPDQFDGLNAIKLEDLPDSSREAYIAFLESVFKIDANDETFVRTDIFKKRLSISTKVADIYKKLS